MRHTLIQAVECLARGFGQLCLANDPVSGTLVALGMLVAEPVHAGLAIVGGGIVALVTSACPVTRSAARSGATAVNGVLLGCLWASCPEVPFWTQAWVTVGGAVLVSLLWIGGAAWARRTGWSVPAFTLPYILVAWLCLAGLAARGAYDLHALQGWLRFAARDYPAARAAFDAETATAPRIRALRADGLGWIAFHERDQATAVARFAAAAAIDPSCVDAHVGLGWALLKTGQSRDARAAFQEALQENPRSTDAWNGLGWIHLEKSEFAAAADAFGAALWLAPLCAESHVGLGQAWTGLGHASAGRIAGGVGSTLGRWTSTGVHYVPLTQWVCWALFLLAIGWHSRISLATVVAVLAGVLVAMRLLPGWATTLADPHCVFNLLAISLLLTGTWLPLRPWCFGWQAAMLAATVACWRATGGVLGASTLPLLLLPLNAALVATHLLVRVLVARGCVDVAMPAGLSTTSPETLLIERRKVRIAADCWQMLRDAEQARGR